MYAERQRLALGYCLAEAGIVIGSDNRAARAACQFGVELIFLGTVIEEAEVVGAEIDACLLDISFLCDAYRQRVTDCEVLQAEISKIKQILRLRIIIVLAVTDVRYCSNSW